MDIINKKYNVVSIDKKFIRVESYLMIMEVSTSEIHRYDTPFLLDLDGSPFLYIWTDGNYSCDCNRHIFFHHGTPMEDLDMDCTEGKYLVNIHNGKDDSIIYQEFPPL